MWKLSSAFIILPLLAMWITSIMSSILPMGCFYEMLGEFRFAIILLEVSPVFLEPDFE
jgi:hypothetical protein